MSNNLDFGTYLQGLRNERGLSLRAASERLGIDLTMLSKIEHGERKMQPHLLVGIADLYDLDYKELFIEFLSQRITNEYGQEPYFQETLIHCLRK